MAIQALPSGMVHQQLYISPNVAPRGAPVPQPQAQFKPTVKRPRSPSPQPAVPVSYHQGYGYKPTNVGTPTYQNSPQSRCNLVGATSL